MGDILEIQLQTAPYRRIQATYVSGVRRIMPEEVEPPGTQPTLPPASHITLVSIQPIGGALVRLEGSGDPLNLVFPGDPGEVKKTPQGIREEVLGYLESVVTKDANGLVFGLLGPEYEGRVFYDNEDRASPIGEWMQAVVRHRNRIQTSMGQVGNRRFHAEATLLVQIHAATGEGISRSDIIATAIVEAFEEVELPSVNLQAPFFYEAGEEGANSIHVVEIPFTYMQIA